MSENTDRTERMTGTPSKDRAEAHMEAAGEVLLRVFADENTATDIDGYAVYVASKCQAVIAAALATSFAEGMKRATDALDKYRASLSDIPLGHENPQRGASTYNWKVAVSEEIRDAILAEVERL